MTHTTPYPRLALLLLALVAAACDRNRACAGAAASSAPAAPARSGGGATETPNPADVLARINGVAITRWDVKALATRGGGHGAVASDPGRDKRILENIIQQELARQQAVKLGLHQEAHLKRSLQTFAARSAAQARGVLYEALLRREVTQKISVSEADAKKYWNDNRAKVRTSIHVLQILRRDRRSILRAQAALRAGKGFEAVASDRPGVAGHGGGHKFWDLGFLRWVQIPAAWRKPLTGLAEGGVSGVIEGPGSRFWILKVKARKEDTAGTFESYRATIEGALKRERLESRRQQVLDGLRKQARIEYALHRGAKAASPDPARKKK